MKHKLLSTICALTLCVSTLPSTFITSVYATAEQSFDYAAPEYNRSNMFYEPFDSSLGVFKSNESKWASLSPTSYRATVVDGKYGKGIQLRNVSGGSTITASAKMDLGRYYRLSYWIKGISNYSGKMVTMIVNRTAHKNSLGQTVAMPVSNYKYYGNTPLTNDWQKVEALVFEAFPRAGVTDETPDCSIYPYAYDYATYQSNKTYAQLDSNNTVTYCIDNIKLEPLDIVYNGDFNDGIKNIVNNTDYTNASIYDENGNKCLRLSGFDATNVNKQAVCSTYLKENTRYRLSYRAKTDSGTNTIQPIFQRLGGSLTGTPSTRYHYLKTSTINTSWQTICEDFVTPIEEASGVAYRYPFMILREGSVGTVYLDDVSIVELGSDIYDLTFSGKASVGNTIDVAFSDANAAAGTYIWSVYDPETMGALQTGTTSQKTFSFTVPNIKRVVVGVKRQNGEERLAQLETFTDEQKTYATDAQQIGVRFTDSVWSPDFDTINASVDLRYKTDELNAYLCVFDSADRLIGVTASELGTGENKLSVSAIGGQSAEVVVLDENLKPYTDAAWLKKDTNSEFIYVDSETGKSSGSGKYNSPIKTITTAYNKIASLPTDKNVNLMIKAGTYTGGLNLSQSNREGNINVIGYGGDAVIDGGKTVTGWTLFDSSRNIYRAPVLGVTNIRQFYINGVRGIRARSEGAPLLKSITQTGYDLYDVNFLTTLSNIDDVEFVYYYKWTNPRCGIKSVTDNGDGTVSVAMDDYCWNLLKNKQHLEPLDGPTFIENAYELLDTPGEWYYDKNTKYIYYIPRAFEDMQASEFVVPSKETLTNLTGTASNPIKNISFKNLIFKNSTWLYPDTYGYSDAQSGRIRESKDVVPGAAVNVKFADNVNFYDCTFENLGMSGLTMLEGITNCNIVGNTFKNLAGSGMYVGNVTTVSSPSYNINISNNYIHNIGLDYKSCVGIATLTLNNTMVSHNEIFDVPYSGIHGGYGINTNIYNLSYTSNYIHRVLNDHLSDGGSIYHTGNTSGTQDNPNTINENYIREQLNDFGALYPDNNATGWLLSNNVVDLTESGKWNSGRMRWLHSNPAERNWADNNYTTTADYSVSSTYLTNPDNDPGVIVSNTQVYPDAAWPQAAKDIVLKSGLTENYAARILPEVQIVKPNKYNLRVKSGMMADLVMHSEGGKNSVFDAEDTYIVNNSPSILTTTNNTVSAISVGMGSVTVYYRIGNEYNSFNVTVEVY